MTRCRDRRPGRPGRSGRRPSPRSPSSTRSRSGSPSCSSSGTRCRRSSPVRRWSARSAAHELFEARLPEFARRAGAALRVADHAVESSWRVPAAESAPRASTSRGRPGPGVRGRPRRVRHHRSGAPSGRGASGRARWAGSTASCTRWACPGGASATARSDECGDEAWREVTGSTSTRCSTCCAPASGSCPARAGSIVVIGSALASTLDEDFLTAAYAGAKGALAAWCVRPRSRRRRRACA